MGLKWTKPGRSPAQTRSSTSSVPVLGIPYQADTFIPECTKSSRKNSEANPASSRTGEKDNTVVFQEDDPHIPHKAIETPAQKASRTSRQAIEANTTSLYTVILDEVMEAAGKGEKSYKTCRYASFKVDYQKLQEMLEQDGFQNVTHSRYNGSQMIKDKNGNELVKLTLWW